MSIAAALIAAPLLLAPGERVYASLTHDRTVATLTNKRVVLRDQLTKEGLQTLKFPAGTTGVTLDVEEGRFRATAYRRDGFEDSLQTWTLTLGQWNSACELRFSQQGRFHQFQSKDITGDGVDDLLVRLKDNFDAIKNQLVVLRWDAPRRQYVPVGRLMSHVARDPFRIRDGKIHVEAPLFVLESLPWNQWADNVVAVFGYKAGDDLLMLERVLKGMQEVPIPENEMARFKQHLQGIVDRPKDADGDCLPDRV